MPVFYTPAPQPQSTIPPSSKVPILPAQGAVDNPPIGLHSQLLALLRNTWDVPRLGFVDYTAVILSPTIVTPDNPPRFSTKLIYSILNQWYTVFTPQPFTGYKLAIALHLANNPPFGLNN